MNKYLKNFTNLITELDKKSNKKGHTEFYKMCIAQEFDSCYVEKNKLTTEQEEWLIDEIYDFYISNDYNSINSIVNAFINTILKFGDINIFQSEYDLNYSKTYDKIIENII